MEIKEDDECIDFTLVNQSLSDSHADFRGALSPSARAVTLMPSARDKFFALGWGFASENVLPGC